MVSLIMINKNPANNTSPFFFFFVSPNQCFLKSSIFHSQPNTLSIQQTGTSSEEERGIINHHRHHHHLRHHHRHNRQTLKPPFLLIFRRRRRCRSTTPWTSNPSSPSSWAPTLPLSKP